MRQPRKRKLFITIEGPIGIGKTTLAKWLSEQLGYDSYYEPLHDDVKIFREAYYANMHKYAFSFQIKLFQKRFNQHLDIVSHAAERGAVQDRSIYGDQPFANMLYEAGYIDDLEIETYEDTWAMMRRFLVYPDMMIFLEAPTEDLLARIHQRNRPEEAGITAEYLDNLKTQNLILFNKMREVVQCSLYNWKDPNAQRQTLLDNIKRLEARLNYYNNEYIKTV